VEAARLSPYEVLGERTLEHAQYMAAKEHPRYFLPHMQAPDTRKGDLFEFVTVTEDEADWLHLPWKGAAIYKGKEPVGETSWLWQREYLDFITSNQFTATLKARQLGVSWIWDAVLLWDIVFFPGVDTLLYSIKEEEAVEQVNRIWELWLSLPEHFKYGINVLKPWGNARPSTRIEFEHTDGRVSTVTGMPATPKAGHSRVAKRVLFDEGAHQEYARTLWKAIIPAAGDTGGTVGIVSTANGLSDGSGGGNFFHEVYSGAGGVDYPEVKQIFLPWHTHPERDRKWYDQLNLDAQAKAEQYPEDEDEAFLLTGSPFFDLRALQYYSRDGAVKPKFQGEFAFFSNTKASAKWQNLPGGCIEVYRAPEPDKHYAIGADVATGTGADYSVAGVIDLSDGAPVAELRMKGDYKDFTRQLHFLGIWYNHARLGVEKGGGYGDVVIAYLRDGHEGRKPYPLLYRHEDYDDPAKRRRASYGFPMNKQTRAMVVSELNEWVNQRVWPWLTRRFRVEARTFVKQQTGTSPRADDGMNDDSIMAWGIATAIYQRYGTGYTFDRKKKNRTPPKRPLSPLDPRARRQT